VNFIIVSATLYKLSCSGVDISGSRLIDNAEDLSFVFDFVSFLIISFAANIIVLSIKSNRQSTLDRIIESLDQRKVSQPIVRRRKTIA
jgi:hypothetical protein